MSLEATFALTPRESSHNGGAGNEAHCSVHGVSMQPKYGGTHRKAFDNQHASDELYFY